MSPMDHPFTPEMFQRMDESDDPLFYAFPRKVVHIDEPAVAAVGQFLAATFAPHSVLLDLMSSWRSHLPPGFVKQRLVGLGLNAEEMADNPDLDEYVVHDLNADPRLPFAADYFDGAVVTVSIQYLTQPLAVFADETACSTASIRSASSQTTSAFLPPSSSTTFFKSAAARSLIARPVADDPVKLTRSTSGCVTSGGPSWCERTSTMPRGMKSQSFTT